jgi:hypothetical protein
MKIIFAKIIMAPFSLLCRTTVQWDIFNQFVVRIRGGLSGGRGRYSDATLKLL